MTAPYENSEPIVSRYSEILFGVRHGSESFTVAFLPGKIALAGTPGHQFFLNPGNVPAERLGEVMQSRKDLMERALVHKETSSDRAKFLTSIDTLLHEGVIDGVGRATLRAFIMKCDCPPKRIKEKLRAMGYAHIIPQLDFERYPDELTSTIDAMEKFLNGLPKTTEAAAQSETRSTRARAAISPSPQRRPSKSS
jgi:hypothetical protein